MILHSPTERGEVIKALTRLANGHGLEVATSSLPESLGVDFCWMPDHTDGWYGIQRKELHDFLASVDDGRLTREIAQMKAGVLHPLLAFEGRIQLSTSGQVLTRGRGPNVEWERLMKQFLTLAHHGVQVMYTNSATDTARLIMVAYWWSQSPDHGTGTNRPKPSNDWGKLTNRDFQIHMLMGLDGIGRKTADDIITTLGRCPITVDATVDELMTVPGIGKLTARKIVESINGLPDGVVAKRNKPQGSRRVGGKRAKTNDQR